MSTPEIIDVSKCCGPVQACFTSVTQAGDRTLALHLIVLMRDVAIQCKDDLGTELANVLLETITAKGFQCDY